jgi:hypothetical protein
MPPLFNRRALAKSERPIPPGARLLGELRPDERLSVTFVLRTRPDGQPLPSLEHWGGTPPDQRSYLAVDEFAAIHGADPADISAVESFAATHGMTVGESDAASGTVVVTGTAAQMNEALGITLNRYESPLHVGRDHHRPTPAAQAEGGDASAVQQHRSFEGQVYLPAGLDGIVTAVFGLDDRILGGINGSSGSPPGAVPLTVPQIAQRYNFPVSGAAGQTIGIMNGGGNYDPADITAYIASLPAGYNTAPAVLEVDLTVDGTTYKNDRTKVTRHSSSDMEITQDIETAAAVAQGATIAVYCSVSTEAGWLAFLRRALFPAAGDPAPSVLSSSWFISARDDAATVGQGVLDTLSAFFARAAPRGISIFIAIGDSGSDSGVKDGRCHVQYPGSDPWVTSVGGTVLGSDAEWVWSEGRKPGATDGGVSDYFPVPSYQSDAGVHPTSLNDNQVRRGVPDIAGNSAAASIYTGLRIGGGSFSYWGTSCAAPLYAGLASVLNAALGQPAGFLNPTLYRLGTTITNDVTTGNNDPGDGTRGPFYTAGPGWDACTGWGSIDGRALLNALSPAGPNLWVSFTPAGQHDIWVNSAQGTANSTFQPSAYPPALASFRDQVYLAFVAAAPGNVVTMCAISQNQSPLQPGTVTNTTMKSKWGAPALAVFQARLYAAFADYDTGALKVSSTADGATWTPPVTVAPACVVAPSLAVVRGSLCVLFSSVGMLQMYATQDGTSWYDAGRLADDQRTTSGPALTARDGTLYAAFLTYTGSTVMVYATDQEFRPGKQKWSLAATIRRSDSAPSLATVGGQLYLAYGIQNSAGGRDIKLSSSSDGKTWQPVPDLPWSTSQPGTGTAVAGLAGCGWPVPGAGS